MAPEALFDPGLIKEGDENGGMSVLCHKSVQDCDVDIRKDLYACLQQKGASSRWKVDIRPSTSRNYVEEKAES